jgi:alkylation response protein AidB-like acyl-CoA dehydrogenase
MDVRLSTEQEALRQSAARVVDQLAPHAVGEIGDTGRSARLDAAVAASGWRELRDGDGSGDPLASGVEAAIVAEELGRGLADVPFLGPTLAAELRRLAGVAPGGAAETVGLTSDLSSIAQAADGRAPLLVAVDAAGSSWALLVAPGAGGSHLVLVALPAHPAGPDLTRPSTALGEPAPVTAIEPSGSPISADGLARWTALGLALACADLVGVMRGAVQLATAYAAQRQQYGAPIGSFQAVQHMLADAFVVMEGSRSVALHAAWAVDALPANEAVAAASLAKAYCARSARDVCETAIQVHGGIGNTWECLAHVYLRRALLSSDLLGGPGICLDRVLVHQGIGA